ncbi:MAG: hypothetical protein ACK4MG_10130 [Aquabacterium sp.]
MAAPIDPPRTAAAPLALALAEAALQRQTALLGKGATADALGGLRSGPEGALPAAAPTSPAEVPVPSPSVLGAGSAAGRPPAAPSPSAQVSWSGRVPQGLPGALAPAGVQPAALPRPGLASAPGSAGVAAPAAPGALPPAWPAAGVPRPMAALLQAVLPALLPGFAQAQGATPGPRLLAAQAWPSLSAAAALQDEGAGLPILLPWRSAPVVLHTPDGPRQGLLTLRMPGTAPAVLPGSSPAVVQAAFAGAGVSLQAGVYALLWADAQGQRRSGLLVLELAPWVPPLVYGRDTLQPRTDAWAQMAAAQASGHRPDADVLDAPGPLCDRAGCPYEGRAPCAQPFCLDVRPVAPVAALTAAGDGPGQRSAVPGLAPPAASPAAPPA